MRIHSQIARPLLEKFRTFLRARFSLPKLWVPSRRRSKGFGITLTHKSLRPNAPSGQKPVFDVAARLRITAADDARSLEYVNVSGDSFDSCHRVHALLF
jgi:hypothetical protein